MHSAIKGKNDCIHKLYTCCPQNSVDNRTLVLADMLCYYE